MRRLFLAAAFAASLAPALAKERTIVIASTTSTQDSGLFGHILPLFKAKTGITARVVAQGTGQAIDTARRGDADVLFAHAKSQEEKFVADGFGVQRFDVMHNDFILVGPAADPAGAKGRGILGALKRIAGRGAAFVSRGDRSGTHAAELALWKAAGLDPAAAKPAWYREIGQGMGAALNTSKAMGAYTLADRGSWLAFNNKAGTAIAVEGDQRLFNQYGIILVSSQKHAHVKAAEGQAFIDWVTSAEGQAAIAAFKVNGEPLFFPNARK